MRQLLGAAQAERLSMHVPGHHSGRDMPALLGQWLQSALRIDLTELPGLDNLHDATGSILASQKLAASHYGSQGCYYSVNGSTACVMAAIFASVDERHRDVVVAGPFHWSVWRGAQLARAKLWRLAPVWDENRLEMLVPPPEAIANWLADQAQSHSWAAIVVTSPTYTGRVADIDAYARLAHEYNCPLIVDEAHGAHLGLVTDLPPHSVQQGADIVIHSAHKTLPALTQTAWVHHQGSLLSAERLKSALSFLQTTSPSYLLLASLDVAQAWLRCEAAGDVLQLQQHLSMLDRWRNVSDADPLRIWIPTGSTKRAQLLTEALEKENIFAEYVNVAGGLLIPPYHLSQRDTVRLEALLVRWQRESGDLDPKLLAILQAVAECTPQKCLDTADHFPPQETCVVWQSGHSAVGRISAACVIPYPPGMPILLPGDEIRREHVELVAYLEASGAIPVGCKPGCQFPVLS